MRLLRIYINPKWPPIILISDWISDPSTAWFTHETWKILKYVNHWNDKIKYNEEFTKCYLSIDFALITALDWFGKTISLVGVNVRYYFRPLNLNINYIKSHRMWPLLFDMMQYGHQFPKCRHRQYHMHHRCCYKNSHPFLTVIQVHMHATYTVKFSRKLLCVIHWYWYWSMLALNTDFT